MRKLHTNELLEAFNSLLIKLVINVKQKENLHSRLSLRC